MFRRFTEVLRALGRRRGFDSGRYWESRYRAGGTSGPGSSGEFAKVKALLVNELVRSERISTVVELGCGDGEQLLLADYPSYHGLDVSPTAVARCRARFADDGTKRFDVYDPHDFDPASVRAELAVSLEVIFHLVEDDVYELHMHQLFAAAERFVIICSSDVDVGLDVPQRRHRQFSAWIEANAPEWRLARRVDNPLRDWGDAHVGARQDFFVYARR
jgi:SAM-dependent methyltransferase